MDALVPHELPEFQKTDLLHLHATVGFHPPQQIWAAPGGKAMAAAGVPQESQHVAHGSSISRRRECLALARSEAGGVISRGRTFSSNAGMIGRKS